MVLQRYALRFTISDATLDSLKVPRSTAGLKQDTSHTEKEQKTAAAARHGSGASALQHKPAQPKAANSEGVEGTPTADQLTASPSAATKSESVPPQSPDLHASATETPNRHHKQAIPGGARSQKASTPPQIAQTQPNAAQPAHTLPSPSSAAPRPVPLLAAKPYCQPRNSQAGYKPVKVSQDLSGKGDILIQKSNSSLLHNGMK